MVIVDIRAGCGGGVLVQSNLILLKSEECTCTTACDTGVCRGVIDPKPTTSTDDQRLKCFNPKGKVCTVLKAVND